jgi:DNA polymerase III alpha subunit (gram-positive type)
MYVSVDIEADGPAPGIYSMVSFGAVIVDKQLNKTFFGKVEPISSDWIPEALAVSGYTREETLKFTQPLLVMQEFASWLDANVKGRPMFISDNNGFDWQFINYYFHRFYGSNPFGHSSTNLGSLCKGLEKNLRSSKWKKLRKTKHTHNPVDDAKGNAEALLFMMKKHNLF